MVRGSYNAAERALRGVAIGRKNYLHLGSDNGGHSAAVIYTLIGAAKLVGYARSRWTCAVAPSVCSHTRSARRQLL
ncbi:hypothetical protein CY658_00965 [Variovorax sp. RO1]|nr:hypothetical protein CY658_00965 [Variovorax sp. RO1]